MAIRTRSEARNAAFQWLLCLVLALAVGCGGGGGGTSNPDPTPSKYTLVRVTGTATTSTGTAAPASVANVRPMAAGVAFPNARVRAYEYGTGLEFAISPAASALTNALGYFDILLPKGKDYLLFFDNGTTRLSAAVPKVYGNDNVPVNLGSSLVAEALSQKMGTTAADGKPVELTDRLVQDVSTAVAPLSALVTIDSFTPSDNASIIASVPGSLVPPRDNSILPATIQGIQSAVAALVQAEVRPPSAPVPAITAGNGQVAISWNPVDNADSYAVYWSTGIAVHRVPSSTTTINRVPVSTGTSATISGLTNGTPYYFVVTALRAGVEGPESAILSGVPSVPLPGAPVNVAAQAGNGQVALRWDAAANAASYAVYWSTASPVGSTNRIPVQGLTYTHTGLTNGTTYHYVVKSVGSGGQEVAAAELSAVPDYQAPPAPPVTLAMAKAMVADLRDTAQSFVNYRSPGVTASNGILDNAAGNVRADVDNVIVPYFRSFSNSLTSFVNPSFDAIGRYPLGGNFVWNEPMTGGWSTSEIRLAYTGARTDGKWVIRTFDGLDIVLTPRIAGGALAMPVDFLVTSESDNVLRFEGTFGNLATQSVSVNGKTYTFVKSATLNASFANGTSGGSVARRINASGGLSVGVDAATGDITSIALTGCQVSSPYVLGGLDLSIALKAGKTVYTLNDNAFVIRVSKVQLSNVNLTVPGRGAFTGNLTVDLLPSYLTEERYRVTADNSTYSNFSSYNGGSQELTLFWDERGSAPILAGAEFQWGWHPVLGGGARNLADAVTSTVSGGVTTWHLTLRDSTWGRTLLDVTVDRSTGSAPRVAGHARVMGDSPFGSYYWGGPYPVDTDFSGTFRAKEALRTYPSHVLFYGKYANLDASVPFTSLEGTLVVDYLNAAASDPFIVNEYEKYTAATYPQVRLQFNGKASTPARPTITGAIDIASSHISSGGPVVGARYLKVAGTTDYNDGIESIHGTGAVYLRETVEADGGSEFTFEQASLALKNANNVSFDMGWAVSGGTTNWAGSLYHHPASGPDVSFGEIQNLSGIPRVLWSDGTFESLP
jgi:hypothetical protein